MAAVHSTAIVSKKARLGENVEIGPYAVVEGDVELGEGSKVNSHAVLKDGARIGKSVTVGNFSVISGLPQDFKFKASTQSFVTIGDESQIREGVTINRATQEGEATVVGERCFLMANAHLGHDTMIGSNVVIANGVLLAGFVRVGDFTFIGGNAAVHQFCRIGEGVMLGGLAAVTMDVAPYTMCTERNSLFGLNLVGLKRRGVSRESIAALQACYRKVFMGTGNMKELAAAALESGLGGTDEARRFLAFFAEGKRGFATPSRRK